MTALVIALQLLSVLLALYAIAAVCWWAEFAEPLTLRTFYRWASRDPRGDPSSPEVSWTYLRDLNR